MEYDYFFNIKSSLSNRQPLHPDTLKDINNLIDFVKSDPSITMEQTDPVKTTLGGENVTKTTTHIKSVISLPYDSIFIESFYNPEKNNVRLWIHVLQRHGVLSTRSSDAIHV